MVHGNVPNFATLVRLSWPFHRGSTVYGFYLPKERISTTNTYISSVLKNETKCRYLYIFPEINSAWEVLRVTQKCYILHISCCFQASCSTSDVQWPPSRVSQECPILPQIQVINNISLSVNKKKSAFSCPSFPNSTTFSKSCRVPGAFFKLETFSTLFHHLSFLEWSHCPNFPKLLVPRTPVF